MESNPVIELVVASFARLTAIISTGGFPAQRLSPIYLSIPWANLGSTLLPCSRNPLARRERLRFAQPPVSLNCTSFF